MSKLTREDKIEINIAYIINFIYFNWYFILFSNKAKRYTTIKNGKFIRKYFSNKFEKP